MSDNISRAVAVLQLEAQYTLASEERRGIGYGNQGYAFADGQCHALAWAIGTIRALPAAPPAASEVGTPLRVGDLVVLGPVAADYCGLGADEIHRLQTDPSRIESFGDDADAKVAWPDDWWHVEIRDLRRATVGVAAADTPPTAPPAASAVAEAIEALEFTRWQPTGDLAAWSKTDDGRNHARVMHAIGLLRGIVATPPTAPGERGEAVEALLRRADDATDSDRQGEPITAYDMMCLVGEMATFLRESEARAQRLDQVLDDYQRAGHERDALRAQLTEATAVADIFRAMAERCQACGKLHAADTLIWAQKPHSIHQCVKDVFGDGCGATWLDRNAKHALGKIQTATGLALHDGETPEQFGARLADRFVEATARAERLEAERDAPRATFGLNSTDDWMRLAEAITYCLPGDFTKLPSPKHLLAQLAETRRQEEAGAWENVKRENLRAIEAEDKLRAAESALTAEREAHEETRRKLEAEQRAHGLTASRLCEVRNGVIEALDIPGDENGGVSNERIVSAAIEAARKLATLEAAPDLGAMREELGRVAYGAEHPRGRWECLLDETRERYMATAKAVARRVVQRVAAGLMTDTSLTALENAYVAGKKLDLAAGMRAAIAAALGEVREVEAIHPLVAEHPAPEYITDARNRVLFANGAEHARVDRHEVWVVESIQRLADEVSRLRGRR